MHPDLLRRILSIALLTFSFTETFAEPHGGPGGHGKGGGRAPTNSHGHSSIGRAHGHCGTTGQAIRNAHINPLDTFRRVQLQNSLNDLGKSVERLSNDVKRGNVNPGDVAKVQQQMISNLMKNAGEPPQLNAAKSPSTEGAKSLGYASEAERSDTRSIINQREKTEASRESTVWISERLVEVSPEISSTNLSPKSGVELTPISIAPPNQSAIAPRAEGDVVVGLLPASIRQLDTLLSPSQTESLESGDSRIRRVVASLDGVRSGSESTSSPGGGEMASDEDSETEESRLASEEMILEASAPDAVAGTEPLVLYEGVLPSSNAKRIRRRSSLAASVPTWAAAAPEPRWDIGLWLILFPALVLSGLTLHSYLRLRRRYELSQRALSPLPAPPPRRYGTGPYVD